MNCPQENQDNCKGYEVDCHRCVAWTGKGKLLYQPLSPLPHPYEEGYRKEREGAAKRGSINNSKGRRAERLLINRIGGDHNLSSIKYDGKVSCRGYEYKIEVKKGDRSPFPTKAEREKGKGKIDLYLIESDRESSPWVSMPLSTFLELIDDNS